MAGRPPKYETPEEMLSKDDGIYVVSGSPYNKDFDSESDLTSYIMLNIKDFCKEYLDDDLISAEQDLPIIPQDRFSPRTRRLDIIAKCKKSLYIIELKNPRNLKENREGIGQLLDYGREFPDPKKELILITTKFDINTGRTIKHYGLPIRYVYINKSQIYEYMGDA